MSDTTTSVVCAAPRSFKRSETAILNTHPRSFPTPLPLLSCCFIHLPSAMSKRGADRELTKDTADDEDEMEQQEAGSWKGADQSKLKQRVIVKARRKMGDDSATAAGGTSAVSQSHTQPLLALCSQLHC